ncbi:MAG: hypothetical protein PHW34_13385 [Hespellia sp.]|nr:hypothetical protein [Hespellia sp.]
MSERIKVSDIPDGKGFEDYSEDTIFVWTEDEEEDDWFPTKKEVEKGQ